MGNGRQTGRASGLGPSSGRIVRADGLVATRWQNDGGWTREIHREPAVGDPVRTAWRLSLATIDRTGPFSVLPGVRRHFLLASRTSLTLSIDGVVRDLRHADGAVFNGDAAVHVEALSGTCLALNLMTGSGVEGRFEVADLAGPAMFTQLDTAASSCSPGRSPSPERR